MTTMSTRLAAAVIFAFAPWPGAAAAAPSTAAPAVPGPASASGATAAPPSVGPAPARFTPQPGPFAVEAMNLDWMDQDRRRPVLARLYVPKRSAGPFPIVVFSSGIGAGRNSLEFLGRHLASHGYVSVHLQHQGSDEGIFTPGGDRRETTMKVARDPKTGLARLLDLVFALDQMAVLQASSPVLRGRLDLAAVAVGGQNMGAWTALSAAGLAAVGEDGQESSLPDPRVKAALLLVPPEAAATRRQKLRFEHIKVPCLHVIGALAGDRQDLQVAERRLAFDRISGADQVLVTLLGGGAPKRAERPAAAGDPVFREHVKVIATAFLDAYLRQDAAARAWLGGGGLAAALGGDGRVETRTPASR
jgi:predicted dienelactone hydrolase